MTRFRSLRAAVHGAATLAVLCAPALAAAQAAPSARTAPRVVSLAEAVELAVANSPGVVAAEAGTTAARAGRLQARGAWLPSLSAGSMYGNSSNQRFDQSTGQLVSESYTAQLQASYQLFTGGRRITTLRAASAQVDAAGAQEVASRFRAVLGVKEAYYAAAAASDLLQVAEQRVERARQQYGFAESRYDLGTATRSDLLRAEIEVANAELAVIEAQSSLRSAGLQLGRVMGVAEEVHAADRGLPDAGPRLPDLDVLVARAASSAPGVVAAEAAAASSRAQKLAAYTPYLPSISISGGYDWLAYEFPPREQSWSLRLTASLPVFNGFQREAAVIRAGAAERAAEAQARDAILAARVAVEDAVQEIELAERRAEVSRRTVELATEDLRVQEERYRIGAATILDLQASQVALAEAEVATVRARQGLATAVARLETILGEEFGER